MKRTALVVLGMHDSGIGMLAFALHRAGAGLPQDLASSNDLPSCEEPASGAAWESSKLAQLNEAMVRALNDDGATAASFQLDALEAHSRDVAGKQAAAFLQCQCGDTATYVLHEARLARLLPFWLPVLHQVGHEPRFVIMVRQAHAVAAARAHKEGLDPEQVNLAWLGHVLDAERDTRAYRRVFLTYESWITDAHACMDTITETLGLTWPTPRADIVAKTANCLPSRALAQPSVVNTAHLLQRWSTDAYNLVARGCVGVLPPFFDALREDFDAVARLTHLTKLRCQRTFETELRRLTRAHHETVARLQQERDQALAVVEERTALLVELRALQEGGGVRY